MTMHEDLCALREQVASLQRQLADMRDGRLLIGEVLGSHAKLHGHATLEAHATINGMRFALVLPTGQRYESADVLEVLSQSAWMLTSMPVECLADTMQWIEHMAKDPGTPDEVRGYFLGVLGWLSDSRPFQKDAMPVVVGAERKGGNGKL